MKKINIEKMNYEELKKEREYLSKLGRKLLLKYGVISEELDTLEKSITDKMFELLTKGE